MADQDETVPLAVYKALERQLHRWQTGTEIESDHIPHWVTRSEFEELEEKLKRAEYQRDQFALKLRRDAHEVEGDYADGENILEVFSEIREGLEAEGVKLNGSQLLDDLEESRHGDWVKLSEFEAIAKRRDELESELSEAHEKIGILMEPIPETHGDFPWQMMRLWVANYAQEKQAWREAEEERDRLRKHLKEAGIKRANYKREVRRLQDALLRQRGQQRWVEIERLEQRVKALEGSRRGSPTAALEIFDQLQELERRIVRNAGRVSRENKPRWAHVLDVTAHGSTVSADMCRRHGVDPDELIGGEDENESNE